MTPRFDPRSARQVAALLATLAAGSARAAAPGPLGDQFQANTVTTSDQARAAAAVAPDGSFFVVAWESFSSAGGDASLRSIQARRYAAGGAPLGGQFQVNSTTPGEQMRPAVAVGPANEIVFAWESDEGAGGPVDFDVRARVFHSNGTPLAPDFLVNTYLAEDQRDVAVAISAGTVLFVWQSDDDPAATEDWNVVARPFDLTGAPLGSEVQVNALTAGGQEEPAVGADAAGNFLIAWKSAVSVGNDNTTLSIQARWLGATPPVVAAFQVNDHPPVVFDRAPAVAVAADGRAAVVWESGGSTGGDASLSSIQARRYAADGTPGAVFQVNSFTPNEQRHPAAALAPDGTLVATWQSFGSAGDDASLESVQLRAFAAGGGALATDLQINTYTAGAQRQPALALAAGGTLLASWESAGSPGDDASGTSLQARWLHLALLFADDYETGNFSRWSIAP